jgi:CheY-like chemotaxis protein
MNTAKTILLVEDEADDRFFFTRAAQKAGVSARIQCAGDGQEAIDYLSGNGAFADRSQYPLPDLAVVDLKLPLATGFEVLAEIRRQPRTRHLPVVILTSSQSEEDISRAYATGANSYLVKPSNLEDLLGLVRTINEFWLEQNRCPRPASAASQ